MDVELRSCGEGLCQRIEGHHQCITGRQLSGCSQLRQQRSQLLRQCRGHLARGEFRLAGRDRIIEAKREPRPGRDPSLELKAVLREFDVRAVEIRLAGHDVVEGNIDLRWRIGPRERLLCPSG